MAVPPDVLYSMIQPELEKAWLDKKYKVYINIKNKVNKIIQSALVSRTRELLDAEQNKETARENLQTAPSPKSDTQVRTVRTVGFVLLIIFVLSGLATTGVVPALNPNTTFPEISSKPLTLFPVALASLLLTSLAQYRFRSTYKENLRLRRIFDDAKKSYETIVTKITIEELNKAINLALEPQGAAYIPDRAPALVELSSTEVVQSRAVQEVRDFIEEHDSSAIGIAGPRGIGKTTLLSYLVSEFNSQHGSFGEKDDPKGASNKISLFLSAPVYHDTKEFMTTLLLQLAEKVDQHYGAEFNARRERSKERTRRQRQLFFITLGVGLLIILSSIVSYWVFEFNSSSSIAASSNSSWLLRTVAVGLGMAVVIAMVSLTFLMSAFSKSDESLNEAQILAFQLMERIRYQSEASEKSDNRLNIFGRKVSLADETSQKRVDRDPSLYQLSQDARLLLTHLSSNKVSSLIVVDELDKISKVDHLIEVVNALKDLMHIPGCHTLVSVSIEALHSFELRGFSSRNAFESTFDEIFDIGYLTIAESYEVINKKVVGFPVPLSAFCHIWSGGLPRELLRVARECVKTQRDHVEVLTVKEIAQTVSATRIDSLIGTVFRDISLSDQDREVLTAASKRHKQASFSKFFEMLEICTKVKLSPKVLMVIKAIEFEAKAVDYIVSINQKCANMPIEQCLEQIELDTVELMRQGRFVLTENSAPFSSSTVNGFGGNERGTDVVAGPVPTSAG